MNILEIAKQCGASQLFSKTKEELTIIGNSKIEAFAKAIAEQSLAKYIVNCNTCANRDKVNGLSQDLFCDSCIHATKWKVSHFKPLPGPPKDYP